MSRTRAARTSSRRLWHQRLPARPCPCEVYRVRQGYVARWMSSMSRRILLVLPVNAVPRCALHTVFKVSDKQYTSAAPLIT